MKNLYQTKIVFLTQKLYRIILGTTVKWSMHMKHLNKSTNTVLKNNMNAIYSGTPP